MTSAYKELFRDEPFWAEKEARERAEALAVEAEAAKPFRLPEQLLKMCSAAEELRVEGEETIFNDRFGSFSLMEPSLELLEGAAMMIAQRERQRRRQRGGHSFLDPRNVSASFNDFAAPRRHPTAPCCLPSSLNVQSAESVGLYDPRSSSAQVKQQQRDCDATAVGRVLRAYSFVRRMKQGCARFAASVAGDFSKSANAGSLLRRRLREVEEHIVGGRSGDVDVFFFLTVASITPGTSSNRGTSRGGFRLQASLEQVLQSLLSADRYPWIAAVVVEVAHADIVDSAALVERCFRPTIMTDSRTVDKAGSSMDPAAAAGVQAESVLYQVATPRRSSKKRRSFFDGNCSGSALQLRGTLVSRRSYSGDNQAQRDASCCRQCRDTAECEAWARNDKGGCWLLREVVAATRTSSGSSGGGGGGGGGFGDRRSHVDFSLPLLAPSYSATRGGAVRTPLRRDPLSRLGLSYGIAYTDHALSSGTPFFSSSLSSSSSSSSSSSKGANGQSKTSECGGHCSTAECWRHRLTAFFLGRRRAHLAHLLAERHAERHGCRFEAALSVPSLEKVAFFADRSTSGVGGGGGGGGGDAWKGMGSGTSIIAWHAPLAAAAVAPKPMRRNNPFGAQSQQRVQREVRKKESSGAWEKQQTRPLIVFQEFEVAVPKKTKEQRKNGDAVGDEVARSTGIRPTTSQHRQHRQQHQQQQQHYQMEHWHQRVLSADHSAPLSSSAWVRTDLRCFLASPNGPVLGTMRDVGRFTGAYRDLRYSWSLAAPRALDGCRHWAGRVLLSTFLNWPALWWIDAPLTFREER